MLLEKSACKCAVLTATTTAAMMSAAVSDATEGSLYRQRAVGPHIISHLHPHSGSMSIKSWTTSPTSHIRTSVETLQTDFAIVSAAVAVAAVACHWLEGCAPHCSGYRKWVNRFLRGSLLAISFDTLRFASYFIRFYFWLIDIDVVAFCVVLLSCFIILFECYMAFRA